MTDLINMLGGLGRDPRFHGNGFTQLYLGPDTRLHVWDERLPRIPGHNAAVHDHVYSMQSRVLMGTLVQVTHEAHLAGSTEQPYDEWSLADAFRLSTEARRDPRGMPGFEPIGRVLVRETGRLRIAEGSSYTQARDTLHDSEPGGALVATLFERLPQPTDKREPRILCPAGEQPMNAFNPDHQPPIEAMWAAIGLAVQVMSPYHRNLLYDTVSGHD